MSDTTTPNIEPVTLSDVLGLASWNRARSDDELRTFRQRREAAVADLDAE